MFRPISILSVAALAALAAPVLAQDTAAPAEDDAAAQTVPAEDKPAKDLLDMGQPADGQNQAGERYSKQKFDDWDLACIRTGTDADPCSLLQVLTDKQGQPMAEISLFRLEGGGQAVAGATVIVPLETLLPAQLTIAVDGAPGKRYNYSFCNPIGCVAQIGLTDEDIAAFKKGKEATVALVPAPAPDQVVKLTLSLKGFTAGYDAVDVVQNQ
ncbi:MAG: invasion associated locus B family protein [Jhaorihella sp.]